MSNRTPINHAPTLLERFARLPAHERDAILAQLTKEQIALLPRVFGDHATAQEEPLK